jgi:predicted DCC family thiol-disulfide oxidoreductase YuxK
MTGWVLYDANCRMCVRWARRFGPVLKRSRFRIAPLQTPWVLRWLAGDVTDEMKVLTREGAIVGGADALIYLARLNWWSWPIWAAGQVPVLQRLFRRGYRWVAARRNCVSGACGV